MTFDLATWRLLKNFARVTDSDEEINLIRMTLVVNKGYEELRNRKKEHQKKIFKGINGEKMRDSLIKDRDRRNPLFI